MCGFAQDLADKLHDKKLVSPIIMPIPDLPPISKA